MALNEYLTLAGEYCIEMEWNHDAIPELAECLERHDKNIARFLEGEKIARQYAIDKGVELQRENFNMKEALEKIANLPTDQLASPEQCVAVVLAMDALSELPNVQAQR